MSRVIPALGSKAWQRWDAPNVSLDRRASDGQTNVKLPTEEELKALRQLAYEEGFAAGRADGLTQGRQEVDAQAQRLRELIQALARPFQALDKQVENELIALVTGIVRQLLRREIRTDPTVVVAAMRAALAVLPVASRNISVQLHPSDAALVRELLAGEDGEQEWRIAENATLARGGCVVATDTSRVDATVERRLSAAILKVFGGDRHADAVPRSRSAAGEDESDLGARHDPDGDASSAIPDSPDENV
jgi:flagellar assembly protein FliH